MEMERERLIEIVVSVTAVGIMFGLLYFIGAEYTDGNTLSTTGGELLVYAIIAFIFLMSAVGVVLAYTVSEGEPA